MVNSDWKTNLKVGPEKSQVKLRFDLFSIPISTIATQFYCEKEVEFAKILGKVTSDEELLGTGIHDDLIDSKCKKVSLDEIIESIEGEEYSRCVFSLWFQLNGVTINGRPDLIIFKDSKPVFLIELKSTSRYLNRTYENQEVQSESYGLALEEMGFNCQNLILAIVLVSSREWNYCSKDDFLSPVVIDEVLSYIGNGKKGITNKFLPLSVGNDDEVMWHLKSYNRPIAIKKITWAIEYWLMERDASFANHPGKCRVCPYNGECPKKPQ
jgi:hypothetical protein